MTNLPYPQNFAQICAELLCMAMEESREEMFARMHIFSKQKTK